MPRAAQTNWDKIMFKPPLCYFPPIWEILINHEIGEYANKLVSSDPTPEPARLVKYFNTRIDIVNRLVEGQKLDAKIGRMAIRHFKAHLKELNSIRM